VSFRACVIFTADRKSTCPSPNRPGRECSAWGRRRKRGGATGQPHQTCRRSMLEARSGKLPRHGRRGRDRAERSFSVSFRIWVIEARGILSSLPGFAPAQRGFALAEPGLVLCLAPATQLHLSRPGAIAKFRIWMHGRGESGGSVTAEGFGDGCSHGKSAIAKLRRLRLTLPPEQVLRLCVCPASYPKLPPTVPRPLSSVLGTGLAGRRESVHHF
jgi:hypothetical protein